MTLRFADWENSCTRGGAGVESDCDFRFSSAPGGLQEALGGALVNLMVAHGYGC